jgi:hypothetical protein
MNITENELPNVLNQHANDAPGAEGLLAAVHARSRRKTRRRTTASALATAAVFTAAGGVVAYTGMPGARGPVVLTWQNASSSFLVPADLRPSFPVAPDYLPPGLEAEPRLSAERGSHTASWERLQSGQDGPLSGLSATVSTTEPDRDDRTASTSVDIGGRTAALRRYEALTAITWQRAPGQWVHVNGSAPVTEAQTLAFARSLRDEPIRQEAAFELDVAPEGHVLAAHHSSGLTLGPSNGTPTPQDDARAINVAVRRASDATDGHGTAVRIRDRSGWLDEANGRFHLVLRMEDDLRLDVNTPATGEWDREELARFVNGITYSGETPRREG